MQGWGWLNFDRFSLTKLAFDDQVVFQRQPRCATLLEPRGHALAQVLRAADQTARPGEREQMRQLSEARAMADSHSFGRKNIGPIPPL